MTSITQSARVQGFWCVFVCVIVLVLVPRVASRACSCWGLVCSGWVVPVLLLVFGLCCVRYSATFVAFCVCETPVTTGEQSMLQGRGVRVLLAT